MVPQVQGWETGLEASGPPETLAAGMAGGLIGTQLTDARSREGSEKGGERLPFGLFCARAPEQAACTAGAATRSSDESPGPMSDILPALGVLHPSLAAGRFSMLAGDASDPGRGGQGWGEPGSFSTGKTSFY